MAGSIIGTETDAYWCYRVSAPGITPLPVWVHSTIALGFQLFNPSQLVLAPLPFGCWSVLRFMTSSATRRLEPPESHQAAGIADGRLGVNLRYILRSSFRQVQNTG